MEAIPLPRELIVPLTVALIATVMYLLKDINKGKGLGDQIWNVLQGLFGLLVAFWLILNVMLSVTGLAWGRFIRNEYVAAFLEELEINTATFPNWVTIIIAIALFYLAIKVSSGNGKSVWDKILNILKYYVLFLVLLGILSGIVFTFVNAIAKNFLSNPYVFSLLQELELLP